MLVEAEMAGGGERKDVAVFMDDSLLPGLRRFLLRAPCGRESRREAARRVRALVRIFMDGLGVGCSCCIRNLLKNGSLVRKAYLSG